MKHTIQVRKLDGTVVETIQRTLKHEAVGNFCPVFCRYQNNTRQVVHSDKGDLSDPFRREPSYLTSLFIIV